MQDGEFASLNNLSFIMKQLEKVNLHVREATRKADPANALNSEPHNQTMCVGSLIFCPPLPPPPPFSLLPSPSSPPHSSLPPPHPLTPPSLSAELPPISLDGDRSELHVTFHLHSAHYAKLPPSLQSTQTVKLQPVLFNKGIIHCTMYMPQS